MNLTTKLFISAFFTIGGLAFAAQVRADDDAAAIIKSAAESLRPPKSFSVLSQIDTFRNREAAGSMTLRTYIKTPGTGDSPDAVSIVLFPEGERGKVFLRLDEVFWLYDPGAQRPVQISTQQRLMGDASLADVTHFDLEKDYSAVVEGDETIVDAGGDSVSARRLLLTARSKDVQYPTLRLWVSTSRKEPVKIECHSTAGKILKTVYYTKFRGFLGRPRPTELTVVDGTAPGRVTRIRFSDFVYQELQKEAYTPEAMPSVSNFAAVDAAVK